ncbi:MAG: HEAT repeat domain-containing protein [Candidatus Freyarchaeota archaeon]
MWVGIYVERRKGKGAEKSEASALPLKYEEGWAHLVGRLVEALRDENKYVRWGAAGALGELGDRRAVEPLIEALSDEEAFVRERVAWALRKMRRVPGAPGREPRDAGEEDDT